MTPIPSRRRRRRLALGLAATLLIVAVAVLALPGILGTATARAWLLERANTALAPAMLDVGRFEFSWSAPTVLRDVRLVDAEGRSVIEAARVSCDRTLFGLLFDRPRFGVIDLGDARWDLQRDEHGRINLVESLRPILTGNPELSLTVRASGGPASLRDADLGESLLVAVRDLSLIVPPAPDPWSWRVRLGARSGPGEFTSEGTFDRWRGPDSEGSRVAARHALRDWEVNAGGIRGTFSCSLDQRADGRWDGDASGRVGHLDFAGGDLLAATGPVEWKARGGYDPGGDELELASLDVAHPWGRVTAEGKVGHPASERREGALAGSLMPARAAIERIADWADEPLTLGHEPVRFEAELRPDRSLSARLGALDVAVGALTLAIQPIRMQASPKAIQVGAIEAKVNGGRLHLAPRIVREPGRGWVVALGPDSFIEGMALNDRASREALAYIAPVLAATAEIRGTASARVRRAEWAFGGDPVVEGEVIFSDLQFAPSPLTRELLSLAGRDGSATGLTLDRPISLEIADRKVRQRGLSIPCGDARVDINGVVGFDRTIDLEASIPITAGMVGSSGFLSDMVRGQRVDVPISGTLDQPRIDGESFRRELAELGKSVARRGAVRGILGLLRSRDRD